jgi:hypothetical protein
MYSSQIQIQTFSSSFQPGLFHYDLSSDVLQHSWECDLQIPFLVRSVAGTLTASVLGNVAQVKID